MPEIDGGICYFYLECWESSNEHVMETISHQVTFIFFYFMKCRSYLIPNKLGQLESKAKFSTVPGIPPGWDPYRSAGICGSLQERHEHVLEFEIYANAGASQKSHQEELRHCRTFIIQRRNEQSKPVI